MGGNVSYTGLNNDPYGVTRFTTIYGETETGAIVGEGADAAIAIGGAYSEEIVTKNIIDPDTGKEVGSYLQVDYEAASAYGKRSIALGSGAKVISKGTSDHIQSIKNSEEYHEAKNDRDEAYAVFRTRNDEYNAAVEYRDAVYSDPDSTQAEKNAADEAVTMAASKLSQAERNYQAKLTNFNALEARVEVLEGKAAEQSRDAIAIGTSTEASLYESIAIGKSAVIGDVAPRSIAFGTEAKTGIYAQSSIAFGTGAETGSNAIGSIAFGVGARTGSNAMDSVAIGINSNANKIRTIAIGKDSKADADHATAIGMTAEVHVVNGVAIGSQSIATLENDKAGTVSGVIGYDVGTDKAFAGDGRFMPTWMSTAGSFYVGGGTNEEGELVTRRIQNVAPGLISAESTGAINGSQLYQAIKALTIDVVAADDKSAKVEKSTSNIGDSTGGGGTGSTATTTYTISAGQTTIQKTDKDTSMSGNLTIKDELETKETDPKSYDYKIDLAKDITVDSVKAGDTTINNSGLTIKDGPSMTKEGFKYGDSTLNDTELTVGNATVQDNKIAIDGGPSMTKEGVNVGGQKITNVANGDVSANSTDAVNGGQLYSAIDNVNHDISNVDNRARKGIAGAAALAALHPMEFDPDDKLTFAAGMGHYRGETAAALGMFYRPDEKVMFSLGGTVGNGENMVNAGVSFSLDRTPRVTGSRTALTKEVVHLREQVARQDAQIAKQDQQIAMQGAQIAQLTALVSQLTGAKVDLPALLEIKAPTPFPDNLDNKWAYDKLEELEQQGYIKGFAGRTLSRNEFAAALDTAMARGAKLDERIVKEFEPELSHVRIAHVEGKGNEEGQWYERPRFSHDKVEKNGIAKKQYRIQPNK